MHSSFGGQRPQIQYPCLWTYQVIGREEALVRAAVVAVIGAVEYRLNFSHQSSAGKYCSLELQLSVRDDEERLVLFRSLAKHPDIRYVL